MLTCMELIPLIFLFLQQRNTIQRLRMFHLDSELIHDHDEYLPLIHFHMGPHNKYNHRYLLIVMYNRLKLVL